MMEERQPEALMRRIHEEMVQMEERQPEALMRRIHEEMVQADLFEIAMISRLSKRLLKIRKPKAAEKKPVDRAKVKAARAQRVRNRGR